MKNFVWCYFMMGFWLQTNEPIYLFTIHPLVSVAWITPYSLSKASMMNGCVMHPIKTPQHQIAVSTWCAFNFYLILSLLLSSSKTKQKLQDVKICPWSNVQLAACLAGDKSLPFKKNMFFPLRNPRSYQSLNLTKVVLPFAEQTNGPVLWMRQEFLRNF